MLMINGCEYPWKEGMSIRMLIDEIKDHTVFQKLFKSECIVVINKKVYFTDQYDCLIEDNTHIHIAPLAHGG